MTKLILLNTGLPTRFNSHNGQFSHIDLTLADPRTATLLEWEPLETLYDSDHFPIKIDINIPINQDIECNNKTWNLKAADWNKFQELVDSQLGKLKPMTNNINKAATDFTNVIQNAAIEAVGYVPLRQTGKTPVPWWNDECKEAIKNTKKAFNSYKRKKTVTALIEFKKLRAISRRTINLHKKRSWNEYVSTINAETPILEVWNKIGRIKGKNKKINTIRVINTETGPPATSNKEIGETIAKTLAKNSSDDNYSEHFLKHKHSRESSQVITEPNTENKKHETLNLPISLSELKSALERCRNSSPGPDNIPYMFLKHLSAAAMQHLLNMYNIIWKTNQFPEIWREATVIPILKQNKDKTNPQSYRPISLTSTLCKLMEKVINQRLIWFLEANHLLSNSQNGFRANRSTTDNLVYLQEEILSAYSNNQQLSAVFSTSRKLTIQLGDGTS